MEQNEIKTFHLEKHITKNILDGHTNGFLIPAWKDWENIVTVEPKMVYVTSVNPGERKGPHLHKIRHSYYVCIKGKVVFIIKDRSGNYLEIESSEDDPVLVEIPKNYSSAHINLSKEPSIILSLVNPAWRPENKDEYNERYDDYDWKKWNKYL